MDNSSDLVKALRKAAPYINASYTIIASVALFGFIGWWLDSYFNTRPVLFIVLLFLGLIAGFYNFYKVIVNLDKQEK